MKYSDRDYASLIRESGIDVDYAYLHTAENEKECIVVRVVAVISGDLTFDTMEKASILMGTRKIDITCDLGCESDRSHDTKLVFHNPSPPRWLSTG